MPRLKPNLKRETNSIKSYIGKSLIFCEGTTEYNYLEYFIDIFKINEKSKYTNIALEIEMQNVHGNAQTVYKYAEEFLQDGENAKKYKDFDKFLIFDCDDPKDISSVLKDMLNSAQNYKLLLTNLLFETWLLMHYEIVDSNISKSQIYKKMADHLGCIKYSSKEKANKGNIRKIIGDGQNIKEAIRNARNLENEYKNKIEDLVANIEILNPYTKVHLFIEQLLYEIDNMNKK